MAPLAGALRACFPFFSFSFCVRTIERLSLRVYILPLYLPTFIPSITNTRVLYHLPFALLYHPHPSHHALASRARVTLQLSSFPPSSRAHIARSGIANRYTEPWWRVWDTRGRTRPVVLPLFFCLFPPFSSSLPCIIPTLACTSFSWTGSPHTDAGRPIPHTSHTMQRMTLARRRAAPSRLLVDPRSLPPELVHILSPPVPSHPSVADRRALREDRVRRFKVTLAELKDLARKAELVLSAVESRKLADE